MIGHHSPDEPAPWGTGRFNFHVPEGGSAVASNGTLFVPDLANNRLMAFAPSPTSHGAAASYVIGQSNFDSRILRTAQGAHPGPSHVTITGDSMLVSDSVANRVSLYTSVPQSGSDLPTYVLGQPDFTTSTVACSESSLRSPRQTAMLADGRIVIADRANNRVLIWRSRPIRDGQAADVVLGQALKDQCQPNRGALPSSVTLKSPGGVWTDGTRLVVSDTGNHRVLIWNSFPETDGQAADYVLGQSGFSGQLGNQGSESPTAASLWEPIGIASDGVALAVADSKNHRVLIWHRFPSSHGADADAILGQREDYRNAPNDRTQDGTTDSVGAMVLNEPRGLNFHAGKLYVSDAVNSRVLVFSPPRD